MGRESNKQRRAANEQTARERAAAMRLEQQRRERRRRIMTITGVTLGVLAVVGVIIGLAAGGGSKKVNTHGLNQPLPAAQQQGLKVSDAALQTAGSATSSLLPGGIPQKTAAGTPPLTSGGKPEVLYIGAEFCPYCAAERWALAVALDRFGTLQGLKTMRSSPTDVDASTPTVTFRDASYTSDYLAFKPIENETIDGKPLQKVGTDDQKLWTEYTYNCSSNGCGDSFPFIDFGGTSVITGPTYDPAVLKGLTQAQIIADLKNPSSDVAKAILPTANYMTAALCQAIGNKAPAGVCTPAITKLEGSFPAFKKPGGSGSTASGSPSPSGS